MDQQSGWHCFSVRTAPFSGWTDVTDCDSFCFPRLSSKICASGVETFDLSFSHHYSSFSPSTDFQLFFDLFPSGI